MWTLALIALPVCWWLQPAPAPHLLLAAVPLLLLLTVLTMALPVGRLGTRRVRFGGAAVFYCALLCGASAGAAVSLLGGAIARKMRQRECHEIAAYASVLALSALVSGAFYHYGKRLHDAVPANWLDWLRVLVAAVLFVGLRVVLLWWCEGARKGQLKRTVRVEGIVEAVTLPTVFAAMMAQRQWGWLALLPISSVAAVGLMAMRALIQAHLAQRQVRALQTLHHRLITHLHPDRLLQDLGEEIQRLMSFDRLSLWSYARQEAHLQNVGVYPQQERAAFPAYLQVEGILGKAIDHRKPVVLRDALRARLHEVAEHFQGHLLIIPLAVHDYPWGVLILERAVQHEPYVLADYEAIRVLVDHLAILLENMRLYRQTMEMAVRDGLTGLLNHRRLHERLKEELARALRYHHPLTLLMIDVDYFKRYNDTYGHQQGDELLRTLAEVLRQNVRQSDIVGRYGGEEFVIILPETGKESAVVLAQRLCEVVANTPFPGHPGGAAVRCTISIGVASFPDDGLSVSDLVAAADAALYRAKRTGKNRVVVAP